MAFFLRVFGPPVLFAVTATACSGRERPIFGPDLTSDTIVPIISFSAPPAGTTVTRGDVIDFFLHVSSQIELIAVKAIVTGAVNFEFPVANPGDTTYTVQLPVPTGQSIGDTILVSVTATDVLRRQGTGDIRITLQDPM
ncbi:MAG: hypothetical protein IH877_08905 [Gemmatimonadetes bacterium]|nr:hypothetical protein [Gemmatimonadota bacterium]